MASTPGARQHPRRVHSSMPTTAREACLPSALAASPPRPRRNPCRSFGSLTAAMAATSRTQPRQHLRGQAAVGSPPRPRQPPPPQRRPRLHRSRCRRRHRDHGGVPLCGRGSIPAAARTASRRRLWRRPRRGHRSIPAELTAACQTTARAACLPLALPTSPPRTRRRPRDSSGHSGVHAAATEAGQPRRVPCSSHGGDRSHRASPTEMLPQMRTQHCPPATATAALTPQPRQRPHCGRSVSTTATTTSPPRREEPSRGDHGNFPRCSPGSAPAEARAASPLPRGYGT